MSSSHFVLAMVQLAERGPLPELAAVRQALHLEPTFEFKFHKTKPRQRAVFFEAARAVSFRVRVAVVHKARLAPTYAALTGPALTVEFLTRLTMRASDMEIAIGRYAGRGRAPTRAGPPARLLRSVGRQGGGLVGRARRGGIKHPRLSSQRRKTASGGYLVVGGG